MTLSLGVDRYRINLQFVDFPVGVSPLFHQYPWTDGVTKMVAQEQCYHVVITLSEPASWSYQEFSLGWMHIRFFLRGCWWSLQRSDHIPTCAGGPGRQGWDLAPKRHSDAAACAGQIQKKLTWNCETLFLTNWNSETNLFHQLLAEWLSGMRCFSL